MHIPISLGLVLLTVVVESNPWLVVSHVDKCLVARVAHPYLRPRCGQAVVNEDEPDAGLLWRLASAVHQLKRHSRTRKSTRLGMSLTDQQYLLRRDTRRACKRV